MAKKKTTKDFPCKFGAANINGSKATIRLSVDRSAITLEDTAELLCGSQLAVALSCDPNADSDVEGQQRMGGMDLALEAVATVPGFHANPERFTATLQFVSDSIDTGLLGRFSKQAGQITCERTGDAKPESAL